MPGATTATAAPPPASPPASPTRGATRAGWPSAPDPANPFYAAGARYYDPNLADFTQLDSLTGSAQDPLSLNRYLYAAAKPSTLIDPTGHMYMNAVQLGGVGRLDPNLVHRQRTYNRMTSIIAEPTQRIPNDHARVGPDPNGGGQTQFVETSHILRTVGIEGLRHLGNEGSKWLINEEIKAASQAARDLRAGDSAAGQALNQWKLFKEANLRDIRITGKLLGIFGTIADFAGNMNEARSVEDAAARTAATAAGSATGGWIGGAVCSPFGLAALACGFVGSVAGNLIAEGIYDSATSEHPQNPNIPDGWSVLVFQRCNWGGGGVG